MDSDNVCVCVCVCVCVYVCDIVSLQLFALPPVNSY